MRPTLGSHRRPKPPLSAWEYHFPEYAVPDCIAQAEGIVDYSDPTDAMPVFAVSVAEGHEVQIWVDRPDAVVRFAIAFNDHALAPGPWAPNTVLWEGSDEAAVIPAFLRFLKEYRAWLKNEKEES